MDFPEDPDSDSYPGVSNWGKEVCATRQTKILWRNIYLGNRVSLSIRIPESMSREDIWRGPRKSVTQTKAVSV